MTLSDIPDIFHLDISDTRYKLWSRFLAPKAPKLQAGTYEVSTPGTLSELYSTILAKPVQTDLTITVLPGWNIYDIDDALATKKIITPGSLLIAARDHFTSFQKKYPFLQ